MSAAPQVPADRSGSGFDAAAVRAQFPIFANAPSGGPPLHYLDSGATSQTPQPVIDAVAGFEATARANVRRGAHRLAEAATVAYEDARAAVARYVNAATPGEVVFTGGTTAAINLLAWSLGQTLAPGDEVVISELEHHSNIVPWQQLRDRAGIVLKALPVADDGRIDLAALERVVTSRTRLIAVAHCSNVTGALVDVARLVEAARAVGALVFLDGAQRAPHGPFDVQALGVDFYCFSGHKAYGPTGVGVLWGRAELLDRLPPFHTGGSMIGRVTLAETTWANPPARFEAGTPPIAQAVGLAAALDWASGLDWGAALDHELRLTDRLLRGLGAVPGVRILGPEGLQGRLGVVSFDVEGAHAHDVCQILDSHGVALRGGHHCAQPLMDRFGMVATSRASLAPYNTDADIDALLAGLDEAIAILR